jgi:hypothetical protein
LLLTVYVCSIAPKRLFVKPVETTHLR